MAGDRWGRIIIQNDVPPPRRLHDNRFGRAVCQLHTRRIEIEPFSLSLSLCLARSRLWNWMDRFYCARIKRRVDTVSFSSTKTGKLFPARENELRWKKKKKRKEKKSQLPGFFLGTKVPYEKLNHTQQKWLLRIGHTRWRDSLVSAHSNDDPPFFERIRGFLRHVYRVHSNFSFLSSLPPPQIRVDIERMYSRIFGIKRKRKKGEEKDRNTEVCMQLKKKKNFPFISWIEIIGMETVSCRD